MSFVADGSDDNVLVLFKHLITVEDMAVPVAAMNSLVRQLQQSGASTWMQLEQELDRTIQQLQSFSNEDLGGCARIVMTSGCDLFMKYVTRAFNLENKVYGAVPLPEHLLESCFCFPYNRTFYPVRQSFCGEVKLSRACR